MITSLRALGRPGRNSTGGFGICCKCAAMIATSLSDWNGRCPVTISYSDTPTEYTSERWSTISPLTCSGDM